MKRDIQSLKNSFQVSYEALEESRIKGQTVMDLYHNKQYTASQLAVLRERGAPAETFNVIKLFSRVLIGYYSTVVNTVKANPVHPRDTQLAGIANDIAAHAFRTNQFETEGDLCKLDLLLQGMCCAKIEIEDSGERDEFGRPINNISLGYVSAQQIVIDYMSTKADYSDARYIHRFKWITRQVLEKLLEGTGIDINRFDENHNHLNQNDTEYRSSNDTGFRGFFQEFNSYLLVETVLEGDDGKRYRQLWVDDEILEETEITSKEVKFPYRIQKLYENQDSNYYGIFEEVIESQHAINQAVIILQQLVNTQKIFYNKDAVKDLDTFRNQVSRVNALIEVEDVEGIKVENMSAEMREQYKLIDRGFERIKMLLGVNDSFLGMAFASDSGRKVKLQQNATAMAMRHVTVRIEQFYRQIGWDILRLAKQYYYASRVLLLTDALTGDRWIELNKPLKLIKGVDPETGQLIEEYVFEEVLDPASGEPMKDDQGNRLMAPATDSDTALAYTDMDISLDSVSYNDEDEKAQLLMEQVLSGPMGQSLQAVKPAAYMKVVSLVMKTTKTRFSGQLAEIFEQVSDELNQAQPGLVPQEGGGAPNPGFGQSPKSKALKLPQNTNEGVQ